jgi:hypothetical protein
MLILLLDNKCSCKYIAVYAGTGQKISYPFDLSRIGGQYIAGLLAGQEFQFHQL